MKEIQLSLIDFSRNRNVVLDTIIEYKKNSTCTDCQWIISIVGFDNREKIIEEYDCMLRIDIELDLIGSTIKTLKEQYDFEENTQYRPISLSGMGLILVYGIKPTL